MRTTLEIDDTVLAAARALAQAEGTSLGQAVSRLALRGLRAPASSMRVDTSFTAFEVLHGSPEFEVTDELVAAHRDD
ncbi:DUF2191 domain-containing protein [Nocardioides sp.]|uniref:DUF2191 domain-containing protein n=1 Tax=Nocardioides sp. TaxID=35761 RepID=UPI0026159EF7|nr:DUF2191 domain-containing protein [Nocardioides sp.]